jgi:hypothetical protein
MTADATQEFVNLVATQMASGVDKAVECWMARIESVMNDLHLTTLGRMHAIQAVLTDYKQLTGKTALRERDGMMQRLL